MSNPSNRVPAYCHHKASGQAVVHLDGRDIYLGTYRTAASKAEYNRIIVEWLAAGRRLPADPQTVTIAEVISAFRKHAKVYYRDADGNVSRAVVNIDEAIRPVLKLYGNLPASDFGPLRLKAVRQRMIDTGHVRTNVNRQVTRIRGVFKWAAENELIPPSVFHGLMALQGLRAGRSGAAESEPVKPVAVEHVEAILPHVAPQIAAMLRLQLLTGMRPGEVCIMRGRDIDTTGALWVYKPAKHKGQIHGHDREIYLGPRAQELIRPFLKTDLAAYLFSPADAEAERRAALHAIRKTPMSCGNRPGSNRQRRPLKQPGNAYDVASYRRAITYGCNRAFPPPPELADKSVELKAWKSAHRFHPHQLRHTAATELRKIHGLEAAQAVLGHRSIVATQIYAEKSSEAARKIMAAVG